MYKRKSSFILNLINNHLTKYPSPTYFSYLYNFGFISSICLIIQLISGIMLAMHYCSDVSMAFLSVEHIMRDVNFGWLLRYVHANGASFFFISVYIHIARGLYFQSYGFINIKVWNSGIIIFLLMMAAAFIGYVLPWGQMSFWGATVITNLFSAIPVFGERLVHWIWGGFSVGSPTLSRFFSLHYLVPFIILLIVAIHFTVLHEKGSSNPSQISPRINRDYLALYPYYIIKDFVGVWVFIACFMWFVSYAPDALGHSDNYIEANPISTPSHIVPEWYFLPFYAILRSIQSKLAGVLLMVFAILIFLALPIWSYMLYTIGLKFTQSFVFNYYVHPTCVGIFFNIFAVLGWLGSKPVENPYINIGIMLVTIYFIFISLTFIIVPYIFTKFVLCDNYAPDSMVKSKQYNIIIQRTYKTSLTLLPQSYLYSNFSEMHAGTNLLYLYAWFVVFLVGLLIIMSLMISGSNIKVKSFGKHKPFECGFDPMYLNSAVSMNIQYFRVAAIFLIFDIEILYVLPWVLSLRYFLMEGLFFFFFVGLPALFIIFFGLLYEYVNRVTDWRNINF